MEETDPSSIGTAAAGIGISAATGNWVGAAIGAVGLGMQLMGGIGQAGIAKQESEVSQDEAKQEQAINAQKLQAMKLQAQRQNLEFIRQGQRAQALATSRATNQGANYGNDSGLKGGLAQISDATGNNILGVNQNLGFSTTIAGYNDLISQDKIKMASLQGQSSTQQGITSLGGATLTAGPMIGKMLPSLKFDV